MTVWDKATGAELPQDLPSGRYELRFAVNENMSRAAIAAFWSYKADTLSIDCGHGQRFEPVAIYNDSNNTGGSDLVLLADMDGFWVELIAVALAAIGIGIVVNTFLREIRLISKSVGGQVALVGAGLIMVALVVVLAFWGLGRIKAPKAAA